MTELVAYMARALVDEPEAVEISRADGDEGAVLELRVAADDRGKVIGKKGRVAHTMRTLLAAAHGAQFAGLEIVD
jgi:predicted RNA-binding protein YlqC (UPF0109 family)